MKLKIEFNNPKKRFIGMIYAVYYFVLYVSLGFSSQIIQYLTFNTCIISVCDVEESQHKEYCVLGAGLALGLMVLLAMSSFSAFLLWAILP
jgi:hypothetical protein